MKLTSPPVIGIIQFNKIKRYLAGNIDGLQYYDDMCCYETILFKAVMISKRPIHILNGEYTRE